LKNDEGIDGIINGSAIFGKIARLAFSGREKECWIDKTPGENQANGKLDNIDFSD
jgi:hypothetical protein